MCFFGNGLGFGIGTSRIGALAFFCSFLGTGCLDFDRPAAHGMTCLCQSLGFRMGTSGPGAFAGFLTVFCTGGGCGGPAAHGMAEFGNSLGFFLCTSGPGTFAGFLTVFRTGGGCRGPTAHGMTQLGNGLGFLHTAAVLTGVLLGSGRGTGGVFRGGPDIFMSEHGDGRSFFSSAVRTDMPLDAGPETCCIYGCGPAAVAVSLLGNGLGFGI